MEKISFIYAVVAVCLFADSNAVLWPCQSSDDCTADGSSCSTQIGLCECSDFEHIFSTDFTKCLKTSLLGDTCEDTAQCNLMPSGATCKSGTCDCSDGQTYVQGRCRSLSGLDQICQTDSDCNFGYDRQSVACQDQICDCADGYYRRSGNICRRKSTEINDACVVDTDCDELGPNVKCLNLKCQECDESMNSKTASSSKSAKTQQETKASLSSKDKLFSYTSNTDDSDNVASYWTSCSENGKPCPGLAYSICSNSICLCKQGYYNKNGKCFAELGEIAESSEECESTLDELTRKCVCPNNYFYERSLRSCRKPIQYHLSCTSDSQCSPFGAAFCHPEIPRRCTCVEYAEYDEQQQMCTYKQGLGAECDTNDGCLVANSICSNKYCVCRENYFEKNSTCLAGIGANCGIDDDCQTENAICQADSDEETNKFCGCQQGFVNFQAQCLKEAEEIEDECVDSEQCKSFLGTCIDNQCICTSKQHYKYGRCENKQALGEPCSKAGQCFIDGDSEKVECRNSVCQCKFGYQAAVGRNICISGRSSAKNVSMKPIVILLSVSTILIMSSIFKKTLLPQ